MVSFAMEEGNAEVLKTPEQRELSAFNINDRVRFDENRLEVNGNFHFDENNRLEMRIRNYTGVDLMQIAQDLVGRKHQIGQKLD